MTSSSSVDNSPHLCSSVNHPLHLWITLLICAHLRIICVHLWITLLHLCSSTNLSVPICGSLFSICAHLRIYPCPSVDNSPHLCSSANLSVSICGSLFSICGYQDFRLILSFCPTSRSFSLVRLFRRIMSFEEIPEYLRAISQSVSPLRTVWYS